MELMDSKEGNVAGNDSQSLPTLSGEPKGSRPRRTFEEMAGLRVNERESLKKMDVSSWSEKKKENHARNIGKCQIDYVFKVCIPNLHIKQNKSKKWLAYA